MSRADIEGMTLPMLWNLGAKGKMRRPGTRVFHSSEDAREWREKKKRGIQTR